MREELIQKKAVKRKGKYDEYFDENPDARSPWSKNSDKFYKSKSKKRFKKKKFKFNDQWLKRPKFKEKNSKDFRDKPTY
jgi:hypothetical protein